MVSSTKKNDKNQDNSLQNQQKSQKLFLKNNLSSRDSVLKVNKLVIEIKQGKAIKNQKLSKEKEFIVEKSKQEDDFEQKIQILKNANASQDQKADVFRTDSNNGISKDSFSNDIEQKFPKEEQYAQESKQGNNLDKNTGSNKEIALEQLHKEKKSKDFTNNFVQEDTERYSKNSKTSPQNLKNLENVKISKKDRIKEDHKWNKASLMSALDQRSGDIIEKRHSVASYKRAQAKIQRKQHNDVSSLIEKPVKIYREINISNEITVSDLANKLSELSSKVVHELKKLGVDYKNKDQILSRDVAELISVSLGHRVKISEQINIENILKIPEDNPDSLKPRPPVVAFMGHVDHGKTSLLDAFRSTDVASRESGGITQHIGSYNVMFDNGDSITFIDTPGHEAFMKIRSRGSAITDIIVLVISVEDGIKDQTIEAINHAKLAKVPLIVALNKIDKGSSGVDRIKSDLLSYEIISEELGGDVIFVNVSAKKKINLDKLRESIMLIAEMSSLKANYDANASGVILESKVDSKIGNISTVLIQRGCLKIGDILVSGVSIGRVKSIIDDVGKRITELSPSLVGNISGFDIVPSAGEKFYVLDSEQKAVNITSYRKKLYKRDTTDSKHGSKKSLDELFVKSKVQNLFLIIKVDVFGSLEAIEASLAKIENPEVNVRIINISIGNVNISDINLAMTSDASIIGFNVKTDPKVQNYADSNAVEIVNFFNIYQVLDCVKEKLSLLLSPIIKETCIGSVQVRKIFDINKTGKILGGYVLDGLVKNNCKVKILRQDKLVYEDFISSIKQLKNHIKEVRTGLECGILLKNSFSDAKVEDILKIYEISEEKNKIS